MKKTVLAMLAGMVCAISFACISGGVDYSGDSGNSSGSGDMPGYSSDVSGNIVLVVEKVDVNYLAYDLILRQWDGTQDEYGWIRMILRGAPNKTLAYIAEVNNTNHVENQRFRVNAQGEASFSATVYNRKTVRLPLRVKVGVIQAALNVGRNECFVSSDGEQNYSDLRLDFCDLCDAGDEYYTQGYFQPRYTSILNEWRSKVRNTVSDFSLVLQYQVAGESSWTTVSRTRFSDLKHQSFQWQESTEGVQVSKPKYYFLNGKIDGNFPVGTTLLIRIVAESVKNAAPTDLSYPLTGWESFGEITTYSKVMTKTFFTKHEEVWLTENNYTYRANVPFHFLYINGFSPGLNTLYALDDETGDLNWCPLQWMAVTIGEGRKPE